MKGVRIPLVALLVGTVGCHTLQPIAQPEQFIPAHNPKVVYVTYNDNSIVPVESPTVSGDTLYGKWQGLDEPVAAPLSHLKVIESVQPNKKRTAFAIATITAVGVAGIWAAAQIASGGDTCDWGYADANNPRGRCVGMPGQ
jgi:hypothetical protein